MTASGMGDRNSLEMQDLWDKVCTAYSSVADLEGALTRAQKLPSPEKDMLFVAEEKMSAVRNIIHERLSGLESHSRSAERHGQDPMEVQLQAAEGLMASLPEKWQEAETALFSTADEVTEYWAIAKDSIVSLIQTWERLKAT